MLRMFSHTAQSPVVLKLLERIVAQQLNIYLTSSNLLPSLQSGFRSSHSTETAVLRVLSDLLKAVDGGDVATLVLLDLSAAFDTVDYSILRLQLQLTFGLDGQVLAWFRSFLHGRSQYVRRGMLKSSSVLLICRLPQGSVLGPILFILYTAGLIGLIEKHGFHRHLYADDMQVYGRCTPSAIPHLQQHLLACIDEVHSWMRSNRLQLNFNKSELFWCATARWQHQLPTCPIRIGPDTITPYRRLFEILKFISTQISACRRMSSGLSQAALQSCTSYAAFGVWFHRLCISYWSLPLFYHSWITVMDTGWHPGLFA